MRSGKQKAIIPSIFLVALFLLLLFIVYPSLVIRGIITIDTSKFITRVGTNLYLHGQEFRFIGVNAGVDTVPKPYIGCGHAFSNADVDAMFSQLHQMGVTVDRIWLMQSFTKSATYFDRINYLLSEAKKYNIYLLFTLENQWKNCTQGGYKYASWYRNGYLSPYGSYPLSYKDYVGKIVSRYKDDPSIIMWELVNEPQNRNSDNSCAGDAFYHFASDMSNYIKSLDPNHLIAAGAMDTCIANSAYVKINSLPNIDIIDDDDYGNETIPLPGSPVTNTANRSEAADLQIAKQINKPFFIVESGIRSHCTAPNCYSPQQRADLFKAKMQAIFANGGVGFIVWNFTINQTLIDNTFDYLDPLSQTIKAVVNSFVLYPSGWRRFWAPI